MPEQSVYRQMALIPVSRKRTARQTRHHVFAIRKNAGCSRRHWERNIKRSDSGRRGQPLQSTKVLVLLVLLHCFVFFIPKIASVQSGIRSATARTFFSFFFLSWLMLNCVRGRYKSQVLREANGTQRPIWCVCRKWIMSFVSLMTRGPRSHFIPPPCGKLRLITTLSSDVAP